MSQDVKKIVNLLAKHNKSPKKDYLDQISSMIVGNPNLLIEVFFSDAITDDDRTRLMFVGGGGRTTADYNPTLAEAFPEIYRRRKELSFTKQLEIKHMRGWGYSVE